MFSYFLPLRDPILVQILSLGEVGMHPAERPGDGEEPRSRWECAGMRPEEEIHRFLKEKLGFQGPLCTTGGQLGTSVAPCPRPP